MKPLPYVILKFGKRFQLMLNFHLANIKISTASVGQAYKTLKICLGFFNFYFYY